MADKHEVDLRKKVERKINKYLAKIEKKKHQYMKKLEEEKKLSTTAPLEALSEAPLLELDFSPTADGEQGSREAIFAFPNTTQETEQNQSNKEPVYNSLEVDRDIQPFVPVESSGNELSTAAPLEALLGALLGAALLELVPSRTADGQQGSKDDTFALPNTAQETEQNQSNKEIVYNSLEVDIDNQLFVPVESSGEELSNAAPLEALSEALLPELDLSPTADGEQGSKEAIIAFPNTTQETEQNQSNKEIVYNSLEVDRDNQRYVPVESSGDELSTAAPLEAPSETPLLELDLSPTADGEQGSKEAIFAFPDPAQETEQNQSNKEIVYKSLQVDKDIQLFVPVESSGDDL